MAAVFSLLMGRAITSGGSEPHGSEHAQQAWMQDHATALAQGTELYTLARRSRSAAHLGSAQRLLRRAVALAPGEGADRAESYFFLGASLALGGLRAEAMAAYHGCLVADRRGGGDSSVWHNIGTLHEAGLRHGRAAAAYRVAAAKAPGGSERRLLELGAAAKALYAAGAPAAGH